MIHLCPHPAPSLCSITPSAASQRPHQHSLMPPAGDQPVLLILKPYLQIGLFISPRSFVTLIIKTRGREGGSVMSLSD